LGAVLGHHPDVELPVDVLLVELGLDDVLAAVARAPDAITAEDERAACRSPCYLAAPRLLF
jgi:hypothetical protein